MKGRRKPSRPRNPIAATMLTDRRYRPKVVRKGKGSGSYVRKGRHAATRCRPFDVRAGLARGPYRRRDVRPCDGLAGRLTEARYAAH